MRVIYFDLDCLRDDHLGCYGYGRDTSPNIDALARDSARFTRCYTSDSPCVPSRAALFSGRFGYNNGVVGNTDDPIRFPGDMRPWQRDRVVPMWMRHLRANGVRPISFSNFADRHSAWWFHSGWHEHHLVNLRRGFETADEVNAVVLPWLRDHADEDDYFLHIHYWDIHFPYRSPEMEKWIEAIRDGPPPEWPDEETIRRQYETWHGPRTARDLWGMKEHDPADYPWMPSEVASRRDYVRLIDGYDATIRLTDHYMGQVLSVLEQKGVLDDCVIIVGGDHGDCFGEDGMYMDHYTASEPVLRRPLIIRWPGVTRESTCDELVYLLDLCPTVCEMYGIEPPATWDGQSFMPAVRGEAFQGRDYLVCEQSIGTMQWAVRTPKYLFVRTLYPGVYPIDEPCWLYDVDADPYCTRNLADELPDVVSQCDHYLQEWKQQQVDRHGPHPDPMDAHAEVLARGKDMGWVAYLRQTGRGAQADALAKRLRL